MRVEQINRLDIDTTSVSGVHLRPFISQSRRRECASECGVCGGGGGGGGHPRVSWPLHDIVITNIVWCIAYKREVGRGVVYCPIIVQWYCTRVGNAGGRGNERMVGSCTTTLK